MRKGLSSPVMIVLNVLFYACKSKCTCFIALDVFRKQYWVPIVSIKRNVQFQVYSPMDSTGNH